MYMLEKEEAIVKALEERFPFLKDELKITRVRRIFGNVPKDEFMDVAAFVKVSLNFGSLCTITGLDAGENFQLIYHFANTDGIVLNLTVTAPQAGTVFETISPLYNGALLYEIEIYNLLGAEFRDIPTDIAYPLPDGWPAGQHPLRKDWKGKVPEPSPEGEQ